jgi:hypothetical protein
MSAAKPVWNRDQIITQLEIRAEQRNNAMPVSSKAKNAWASCQVFVLTLFLGISFVPAARAGEPLSQEAFNTPQAATLALVAAARSADMRRLTSILGSDAEQILSSGDPVADSNARLNFVAKYDEMHRLADDDQGRIILYIGADNWPVPIPLVKGNGGWVFDTAAGKEELLYRRVGQNELYTVGVLEELAEAQEEYASALREDGGVVHFAQKIISDPGKHDGLYWPVADDEPESPIGPLVADATSQGYRKGTGNLVPFHGYFYKVLTKQGQLAPGGARNYMHDRKMTRGFAFLAYPAEYRSSGVMTFMINQDGVIVQKDLGSNTAQIATAIAEFNPDRTWEQLVE